MAKETNNSANDQPSGAPELPDEIQTSSAKSSQAVSESTSSTDAPENSDTSEDSSSVDTTLGDDDIADKIVPESRDEVAASSAPNRFKRFFRGYWRHKGWTFALTLLVIIGILLAIPFTRYHSLGLFLDRSYEITVIDSDNGKPVSGATVLVDSDHKFITSATGQVRFDASVGRHKLSISKNYYREYIGQNFVGIATGSNNNNEKLRLTATGRQVPIKVVNKINGQPISNATIKVLDTVSKTDKSGQTTIVLPTGTAHLSAVVTATNYNNLNSQVHVTASIDQANTFSLTPAGKVFFLSNASGSYDVDSANLDGSGRKVALAGTGHEDSSSTALFMSPDGHYGVLVADRVGSDNDQIYAFETASGKISTVDSSDSNFSVVGWSGDYFVYEVYRNNIPNWRSGNIVLKSYNAANGKSTALVTNKAEGIGDDDYAYQAIENVAILDGSVFYDSNWQLSYGAADRTKGKSNSIDSVKLSGGNPSVLKKIGAVDDYIYVQFAQPNPGQVIYDVTGSSGEAYYDCSINNVSQSNTLTRSDFDRHYPEYFVSPDGQQTFWSEERDGKNVLFVGDADGHGARQISSLGDYAAYGWYGAKYLLVSHDNTVYVMPVDGLAKGQKPLEIGNYFTNPVRYQY